VENFCRWPVPSIFSPCRPRPIVVSKLASSGVCVAFHSPNFLVLFRSFYFTARCIQTRAHSWVAIAAALGRPSTVSSRSLVRSREQMDMDRNQRESLSNLSFRGRLNSPDSKLYHSNPSSRAFLDKLSSLSRISHRSLRYLSNFRQDSSHSRKTSHHLLGKPLLRLLNRSNLPLRRSPLLRRLRKGRRYQTSGSLSSRLRTKRSLNNCSSQPWVKGMHYQVT
jgi:hypothetical protein